ncbi:derepression protein [Escherichia coli]|nr:derepression protein [Escherichia coli]
MANRKQHRAIAERRHIRLKSIADSPRAAHVALYHAINTLHRLNSTISADLLAPLYSAIWRKTCLSLQDLIQQQNKLH